MVRITGAIGGLDSVVTLDTALAVSNAVTVAAFSAAYRKLTLGIAGVRSNEIY